VAREKKHASSGQRFKGGREMAIVFLHGVADTFRLWDKVRSRLNGDSVALALPGFGAAIPAGFRADKESYVDWIIACLEQMSSPVDLVGHDWGCMFALRAASLRPDLVRTVAGGNGPISRNYEWHRLAKIWQTPEEGEKFMSETDEPSWSKMLQSLGIDAATANETASRVDGCMKDCILKLYRSAVHVGHEWEASLAAIKMPAMIFWGKQDAECPVNFAHEMAGHMTSSKVVELDCGHWVPHEKPQELLAALQQHWAAASLQEVHPGTLAADPISERLSD
jgi:pimeloyl-ACP methyl ester carboxylesterase